MSLHDYLHIHAMPTLLHSDNDSLKDITDDMRCDIIFNVPYISD